MSETICNPCPEFTCSCPIPECANTLNLGTITSLNTPVFIQVQKQNGPEYLQAFTSEADGTIKLDLTDPNTSFFNHFDGSYLVWATLAGYLCEDDKLEMTSEGEIATTWAVTFKKSGNTNFNEVIISPVVS